MSLIKATDTQALNPSDVQYEHQDSPTSNDWYLKEGIPGEGPRPDWLLPKYQSMEAQAQAYPELMKVSRTDSMAPESYQLEHVADVFETESEFMSSLTAKAKSHRLSQDALGDILGEIASYERSLAPNIDEEVKKLGDNAQGVLDRVQTWANNTLSKESMEELGKIGHTAAVVKMMDEIRQKMNGMASRIPVGGNNEPIKIETVAAIDAEMASNYAKYKTDKAYRDQLTERRARALGE